MAAVDHESVAILGLQGLGGVGDGIVYDSLAQCAVPQIR